MRFGVAAAAYLLFLGFSPPPTAFRRRALFWLAHGTALAIGDRRSDRGIPVVREKSTWLIARADCQRSPRSMRVGSSPCRRPTFADFGFRARCPSSGSKRVARLPCAARSDEFTARTVLALGSPSVPGFSRGVFAFLFSCLCSECMSAGACRWKRNISRAPVARAA